MEDLGDDDRDANASGDKCGRTGSPPDPGRRRFSRAALGGSAVLASLGNRSAWSQTTVGCMSVMTLASFNPQTGMFASAPGGRPEHNEALAAEIHGVAGNNSNFLGTGIGSDGNVYTACRNRDNKDSVCLVTGDWPGNKCPPPPHTTGPPGQGRP